MRLQTAMHIRPWKGDYVSSCVSTKCSAFFSQLVEQFLTVDDLIEKTLLDGGALIDLVLGIEFPHRCLAYDKAVVLTAEVGEGHGVETAVLNGLEGVFYRMEGELQLELVEDRRFQQDTVEVEHHIFLCFFALRTGIGRGLINLDKVGRYLLLLSPFSYPMGAGGKAIGAIDSG